MTTSIYFIRHAEPNYNNHDDLTRELTEKGLQDCQRLIPFFETIDVDYFYSSPFKRAIDTIKPLADIRGQVIHLVDNFRERKIDNTWIEDFDRFTKKQWQDKTYKLDNGESLQEVQNRQLQELNNLLIKHKEATIVIGSHGTALSTLINHFQPKFDYNQFQAIKHLFPFVVAFEFDIQKCLAINL